ncbi:hypothetical protein A4X03_0g2195 [Tilletia caries]|uniref:RNA helicase n=1 Tax=Tilletia caries TaxID=13290 RepID=A0A8T8TPP1_9BASI|nr:hypothetical protein A4X03_0g2195 [Tilletia caries]
MAPHTSSDAHSSSRDRDRDRDSSQIVRQHALVLPVPVPALLRHALPLPQDHKIPIEDATKTVNRGKDRSDGGHHRSSSHRYEDDERDRYRSSDRSSYGRERDRDRDRERDRTYDRDRGVSSAAALARAKSPPPPPPPSLPARPPPPTPAGLPAPPVPAPASASLPPRPTPAPAAAFGNDDSHAAPAPLKKFDLSQLPDVDMNDVQPPDEDEEDLETYEEGSTKPRSPRAARAASPTIDAAAGDATDENAAAEEKMDEAKDDDEVDDLDAFMVNVEQEVAKVNKEDEKRFGKGKAKATVLEPVDDEAEEEAAPDADDLDAGLLRAEDILALAAKKVKKKEMPTVDHGKVNYETFQKAFYHPPVEVQEMSEDQAENLRLELDAIAVRGKDCPKPITKWSHCGLPASCLDVIKKLEYKSPTPIQAQAIPAIMSGRDIIGVAKTGSGKTMAFLLPMFRHIKAQRAVENLEGPIGLIMTPTRELAVQIFRESKPFLKSLGIRAVCAYGGAPISEQIAEMKRSAEIVVATPGRMIDLLTANNGRVTNLRRVTYLVLDEADRMFDMGFEPQVMKIVNNIRPDRQTVLFSATFPKQMESLARKVLRNKPLEITVGGRSVVAPEIEQIVEVREEGTKFNRLLEVLGQMYNEEEDARTLVFVERQEAADDLLRQLMLKGYPTMSLHGGKDQTDRDSTIQDFKNGIVPILTATSVAARGLDVKQLKLVINYDAPNHLEDYIHRAGRTGRAGNKGTCITFITPQQDRFARDLIAALKASKVAIPAELEALYETFKEKLAQGKAHAAGSGFGGKGLERLESDREKALRAQKSAYGEGGGEGTAEGAGEGAAKVKEEEAVAAVSSLEIKVQKGAAPSTSTGAGSSEAFDRANELTIEVKKGAAPENIRSNKTAGGPASASNPALDAVQERLKAIAGADTNKLASALAAINAMQKRPPTGAQAEQARKPKDPDATDYHAIVPINDFPQRARWRVTNKETMSELIDTTGASVTNKGQFYEKGKEPGPGEPPKLQLLIESNDESRVEHAVREIKRLLLEATQAALEAEARGPQHHAPGRYSVV